MTEPVYEMPVVPDPAPVPVAPPAPAPEPARMWTTAPEPAPEPPFVVVGKDEVEEYATKGYRPGYVMLRP